MALDRLCPELQYLRRFWAFLYYIVILLPFLLLFLLLHFLQFTFYLQFSFLWSLHYNDFYSIYLHHSTTFFPSNPRSFWITPLAPFNRNFFDEPASVPKILVEWHFCRFRQFSSFNQFFSNEPASVTKILVEFGFLGHFEAFSAIKALMKCWFLA